MNVLLLCKAFPPVAGGVETFSEQIALEYCRQGHTVRVVTQTDGPRGWSQRQYSESLIEIFNTGPGSQLNAALRMARALHSSKLRGWPHWTHATTWRPALVTVLKRNPLVITVHGREILIVPKAMRPLMHLVFRKAVGAVTISTATQERAIADAHIRNARSWRIAGNGISFRVAAENFARSADVPDRLHILSFARLVERKNIGGALQALARLHASGRQNFDYVIAGDGPLRKELTKQVAEAGMDHYVRFLGRVSEESVPLLYQGADIFLHPQVATHDGSDFEGFGLTIADAMSFGCTVIAGQNAGPDDFIENGSSGFLVDGRDIDTLASLLMALYDDPELRLRVGAAGQRHVMSQLSWSNHVDAALTCFAQSANSSSTPSKGEPS